MPYTSITVGTIIVTSFPPSDHVFGGLVRRLVAASDAPTPSAVQSRLVATYPRAVVRERDAVAGFGEALWYAYRDGRYSPFVEDPWWRDETAARIVIEGDRYVDANAAALELLGTTTADLLAASPGDFTTPAYRELVPWILRLVADTGELHSTSVLQPADGRPPVPVEFHLELDGSRAGRSVSWFREVPREAVEVDSSS